MSWLGLLSVLALVSLSFLTYFGIMACVSIMQISEDVHAMRERIEGQEIKADTVKSLGRKAAIMAAITIGLALLAGFTFLGGIHV